MIKIGKNINNSRIIYAAKNLEIKIGNRNCLPNQVESEEDRERKRAKTKRRDGLNRPQLNNPTRVMGGTGRRNKGRITHRFP
jgi:hypothetical protein